jgi:hypothetical protein
MCSGSEMLEDIHSEMPKQVLKLLLKTEWEIGHIPFVGTVSTDNPFVDPL